MGKPFSSTIEHQPEPEAVRYFVADHEFELDLCKIELAIAEDRQIDVETVHLLSFNRFNRVYWKTPDHIGEVHVSYDWPSDTCHAIYGVTADGRISLYMD